MENGNEQYRFLPYGSVVKLKNDSNIYMIIGLQVEVDSKKDGTKTFYDYVSQILPQGFKGEDELELFNASDIEEVIYTGYMDEKISSYYDDVKWGVQRREKNGE